MIIWFDKKPILLPVEIVSSSERLGNIVSYLINAKNNAMKKGYLRKRKARKQIALLFKEISNIEAEEFKKLFDVLIKAEKLVKGVKPTSGDKILMNFVKSSTKKKSFFSKRIQNSIEIASRLKWITDFIEKFNEESDKSTKMFLAITIHLYLSEIVKEIVAQELAFRVVELGIRKEKISEKKKSPTFEELIKSNTSKKILDAFIAYKKKLGEQVDGRQFRNAVLSGITRKLRNYIGHFNFIPDADEIYASTVSYFSEEKQSLEVFRINQIEQSYLKMLRFLLGIVDVPKGKIEEYVSKIKKEFKNLSNVLLKKRDIVITDIEMAKNLIKINITQYPKRK